VTNAKEVGLDASNLSAETSQDDRRDLRYRREVKGRKVIPWVRVTVPYRASVIG
jgi:hypothetical protein